VSSTGNQGRALNPNANNHLSGMLDLIPYAVVDSTAAEIVAANIQAIIGLNTQIHAVRSKPEYAFIPTRNQFDASKIIKALSEEPEGAPFKLGLMQDDLCLPILTYVYGESQLGGRSAVISLCRLSDGKPAMIYNRLAKIAVHEVGHLLGLQHCWEIDCLMRFSKQLDQLDRLPLHFCTTCEYEISRRLNIMVNNGIISTGSKNKVDPTDSDL